MGPGRKQEPSNTSGCGGGRVSGMPPAWHPAPCWAAGDKTRHIRKAGLAAYRKHPPSLPSITQPPAGWWAACQGGPKMKAKCPEINRSSRGAGQQRAPCSQIPCSSPWLCASSCRCSCWPLPSCSSRLKVRGTQGSEPPLGSMQGAGPTGGVAQGGCLGVGAGWWGGSPLRFRAGAGG